MNQSTKNIEAIYPLSPMQQGMLFHTIEAPKSGMYCQQLSCTLQGNFNLGAFQQAWQQVVERHTVFRTLFVWENRKQPLQVVRKSVELPWFIDDWRQFTPQKQQESLKSYLAKDSQQNFALNKAPLMRCALIQLAEDTYQFVWSYHHLLSDGWCLSLIFQEVLAGYEAYLGGQKLNLPPSRPYRDYITWLQQQDLSQAETYWRKELQGFTAPTPLTVDFPQNLPRLEQTYAQQDRFLSAKLTETLQILARQHHLTLNTLIQGAWAILLQRYSNESDVVFGATVSGRPTELEGVESMVGLFINTLPVRVQIDDQTKLLSWLKQLQIGQIEREQYSYSPLVEIQGWSQVPRGLPLFESIVVFENYPLDAALQTESSNLTINQLETFDRTNYPLTLVVIPGENLSLQINYDSSRFDADTISRMLGHLATLLASMASKPEQSISQLSLLTEAEQHQLLFEFNNTQAEYPQDRCLHQLFEKQVEKTPDAIAVVFEDQEFTYAQLNTRANQLAHYLQTLGVKPDSLVGICVERSLEMIVGILAILKAGGAYVPLDPTYPQTRLSFMLEDAQVKVLLTQQNLLAQLPTDNTPRFCLDSDWSKVEVFPDYNLQTEVQPDNLAYVIYTSGSTGKPKGTMIVHRGVVNYLSWSTQYYAVAEGNGAPVQSSIGFDATITSLFSPLLVGQKVVLLRETQEIEALANILQSESNFSLVKITPAHLQMLSGLLPQECTANHTRALVIGGEALLANNLNFWHHYAPQTRIINEYGPTETVVGCCIYEVELEDLGTGSIPIGHPIANTQLYILDSQRRPVPIGVTGELYIGGAGVARGYLNRPQLTKEKFISNPFVGANRDSPLLYKTGDLARYLADGKIEYLGRSDNQVKIRGLRIELGEIEAALTQHPHMNESVVMVREDTPGDKRLVAYLVMQQKQFTAEELRGFLKQQLPNYMVPSAFVILDSLPLTPNGKVDRRALPKPDLSVTSQSEKVMPLASFAIAPRTPTEELIVAIWSEVLGVEVNINDNFFDLGGHSLLATQVISRLRKAFSMDLPLHCLFEYATVGEFSNFIQTTRQPVKDRQELKIEQVSRQSRVHLRKTTEPRVTGVPRSNLPLSFAQKGLWFLDQLEGKSSTYNISVPLRIIGSLDVTALKQSLTAIINRHETLRTTFSIQDGSPIQAIAPTSEITLTEIELNSLVEIEQLIQSQAERPFDLAHDSLLRVSLLKLEEESHILLLTMHHIISDGWSLGILIREFSTFYEAFSTQKDISLPELPIQYADFAHWQHQRLNEQVRATNLSYWKKQLGDLTVVKLPTDKLQPKLDSSSGRKKVVQLPQNLTQQLKALSRREGVTLFMTLVAGFKAMLHYHSGQDDIAIGTDVANRNRIETEGIIGLFVNQLVLRTDLSNNPTFKELLERVRKVALGAYDHQDLPFYELVAELNPERTINRTPLFQAKFVLQNAPMPALEVADLDLSLLEVDDETAKFDLLVSMWETESGLSGKVEYRTDLFKATTITQMFDNFATILQNAIANPKIRLDDLREELQKAEHHKQINQQKRFQNFRHQKLNILAKDLHKTNNL